jgi:serine/threonine protein kinase
VISVGTVLNQTYRVEAEIGRGAMGVVFRVSHLRLPREFAVKALAPRIHDDSSFSRFRREAEISSKLGHPNIVEVFDFNRTFEGEAYFVMELLEGHDLAAEIARVGALPPRRVVDLLTPVASALGAAHAASVIHRDLKPSNIFLAHKGAREIVKVLDFGVSKILGALDLSTQSESLVGTPAYMSPEQANGKSKHVDARSDQFSLASIAYELLSGRRAFGGRGETPYITLYKIVSQEPLPLTEVPPGIGQVIARALAKSPDDRFVDVAAFLAALDDAVRGTQPRAMSGAAAPTSSAPAQSATPAAASRTRRMFVGGALTITAVVMALMVVARGHRHVPPPQPKPQPNHQQHLDEATKPRLKLTSDETGTRTREMQPAQPRADPAATDWSLVIVPAGARVVLLATDGTRRIVRGPWFAADPHVLRWTAADRPAHVRAEADGYEPLDLPLPADGTRATGTFRLTRRRTVTPGSPGPPTPASPAADEPPILDL